MKHVVMFSSGAGSWAAARRVADAHGTDDLYLVFTDVRGHHEDNPHAGEDEDNYRFLKDAAADVGGELVWLTEGRDIWDVFRDTRYLGNSRQANCSKELKQKPAHAWLAANCVPGETTIYVGVDWTEFHRMPAIALNYHPYAVDAPMTRSPYLDKEDVLAAMTERGLRPPRLYEMGFPHANCGGFCVRAGQAQFQHLLRTMPERYAYHERREQELREHLGKDVTVLRDRRGGGVQPITLRRFRERSIEEGAVDPDEWGGCGCFTDYA